MRARRGDTGRGFGTARSRMLYQQKSEEAASASLGRAVEIVIVLGGKIAGQVVVKSVIDQPLQRRVSQIGGCIGAA